MSAFEAASKELQEKMSNELKAFATWITEANTQRNDDEGVLFYLASRGLNVRLLPMDVTVDVVRSVEEVLIADPTIFFTHSPRGYLIFNTEGSLMGVIADYGRVSHIAEPYQRVRVMVVDYEDDFISLYVNPSEPDMSSPLPWHQLAMELLSTFQAARMNGENRLPLGDYELHRHLDGGLCHVERNGSRERTSVVDNDEDISLTHEDYENFKELSFDLAEPENDEISHFEILCRQEHFDILLRVRAVYR